MRLTLMSATHLIYIDVFTCNHSYHHHTLLSPATATMVTHGKQTNTHTKQQETTTTTKKYKTLEKTNDEQSEREPREKKTYFVFTFHANPRSRTLFLPRSEPRSLALFRFRFSSL